MQVKLLSDDSLVALYHKAIKTMKLLKLLQLLTNYIHLITFRIKCVISWHGHMNRDEL